MLAVGHPHTAQHDNMVTYLSASAMLGVADGGRGLHMACADFQRPGLAAIGPRDPRCSPDTAKHWHVLWTRSNTEHLVYDQLTARGFELYLPMLGVWIRRHGDRRRADKPMFPGYLFLRHAMDPQSYIAVSEARGLVRILGHGWDRLATVAEETIDTIRRVQSCPFPVKRHPYLREGQRVRIAKGVLANVEGIFLREKPDRGMLIIGIDLLQRSVAVELDESLIEPV